MWMVRCEESPFHALSSARGNVYQKLKLCLYFVGYVKIHKFHVVAKNHKFFHNLQMMVNEGML
jgi:hypothetical protein